MAKILVLGASGMLGSMVLDYFTSQTDHEVRATVRSREGNEKLLAKYGEGRFYFFDVEKSLADDLSEVFEDFRPDYVINCIGVIKPYCKDDDMEGVERAIKINALFPYYLSRFARAVGARVIQIATDCVYSGKDGAYNEQFVHDALDAYGKTKSLGEVRSDNVLHLRCSIIGPEHKGKLSLLEWFFGQDDSAPLKGFAHHRWNGVTTLQFARLCQKIIAGGEEYFQQLLSAAPVHHYTPNASVDKDQLMRLFAEIFDKPVSIERVDNIGPVVDRSLSSHVNLLSGEVQDMRVALQELKDYMAERDFYSL